MLARLRELHASADKVLQEVSSITTANYPFTVHYFTTRFFVVVSTIVVEKGRVIIVEIKSLKGLQNCNMKSFNFSYLMTRERCSSMFGGQPRGKELFIVTSSYLFCKMYIVFQCISLFFLNKNALLNSF